MRTTDPDVADADFEDFEEDYDIIRAKWCMDGSTTLQQAAQKLERMAIMLRDLHDHGFVLDQVISNDYGFVSRPEGLKVEDLVSTPEAVTT